MGKLILLAVLLTFASGRSVNASEVCGNLFEDLDLQLSQSVGDDQVAAAIGLKRKADKILANYTLRGFREIPFSTIKAPEYDWLVGFMLTNLEKQIVDLHKNQTFKLSEIRADNIQSLSNYKPNKKSSRKLALKVANDAKTILRQFAFDTLTLLREKEQKLKQGESLNLWELIDLTDRYAICMVTHKYGDDGTLEIMSPSGLPRDARQTHQERMAKVSNGDINLPMMMTRFAAIREVNTAIALGLSVFLLPTYGELYNFDGRRNTAGAFTWAHDWGHAELLASLTPVGPILLRLRELSTHHEITEQDQELIEAIFFITTHEHYNKDIFRQIKLMGDSEVPLNSKN